MRVTVIQVENLSKYYSLGLVGTGTLSRDLNRTWAKLRGKPDPTLKIGQEENNNDDGHIWALQDITFEVTQGEVLGIIGRNGAGKSTLLKILSRVTAPTSGECRIKGRIASLLEVGTGFHPELTGRENIFLNGAILGMTRAEIKQKFDEIVAFAEVEKFIDTPVKRYSSGMYVRLAFAVAAHLDPEILIIDEVLAVGDVSFQKKCLTKMGHVSKEGRTVLFVSHSMPAIENLCTRVTWVDYGKIVSSGSPRQVVAEYINSSNMFSTTRTVGSYQNLGHRRGTGEIQFTDFRIYDCNNLETREIAMGQPFYFKTTYKVYKDLEDIIFSFSLFDVTHQVAVTSWVGRKMPQNLNENDEGAFLVHFPQNTLRARRYYFYLGITNLKNSDVPYDIWDGVGTEFIVTYADNTEDLNIHVGRDLALVTIPVDVSIQKQ